MDASLELLLDGRVVFVSGGRWLHPLFELAEFLDRVPLDISSAELRDKVVGRGSAFLIVRLGIRRVHAALLSRLGKDVLDRAGVVLAWDTLVDRISCATETLLEGVTDAEEAYRIIAERRAAALRRSAASPPPRAPAKMRRAKQHRSPRAREGGSGRLRIGDDWNAITIIALSQNNPLKAIAEFIENSIDARARSVTIVRGREAGQHYLKIIDDGEGIPRSEDGMPDFKYVATHICDSVKKRLKEGGATGLQGEFGIGLLSFWTVGEQMTLTSAGPDGRAWQMEMARGDRGYTVERRRTLFDHRGTELAIRPLLPGLRQLSGERIQSYLASELRDRIRKSGVRITIRDRVAKKELDVRPRQFSGRLLHDRTSVATPLGEVYVELYLGAPAPENTVGLYRAGTRVLAAISSLDDFGIDPWNSGYLQGIVDAPFLQLTPGTRDGVLRDGAYQTFRDALGPLEDALREAIRREQEAEEEAASHTILRSVQRALRQALLALPRDDYSWFEVPGRGRDAQRPGSLFPADGQSPALPESASEALAAPAETAGPPVELEPAFHEYPGQLYKAVISPSTSTVRVGGSCELRCIPRDRRGRTVEEQVAFRWEIAEGEGALSPIDGEIATFTASAEPGLVVARVVATQGATSCTADARITVTDVLIDHGESDEGVTKGLPGYTYLRAPGELWRSRYDEAANLIIINNGHADYLFAVEKPARKLKYICRLFAKEMVLRTFRGFEAERLLERMIELSLYTEEHLR
jgi:hypothetical protein